MSRRSRTRNTLLPQANADVGLIAAALGMQPVATFALPRLAVVAAYWRTRVASVTLPPLNRPILNVRVNSDARVCCRHGTRDYSYYSTRGTVELLPAAVSAMWTASNGAFDYLTLSFIAGETPCSVTALPPVEFEVLNADPLLRELSFAMVDTMLGPEALDSEEILSPMTLTLLHRIKLRRNNQAPTQGCTTRSVCSGELRCLIERLPERCGDNLTVAGLAREIGVSVTTFNERFKLATGSSPHQFLTRLRLEQVASSLRNSNESIASIALSAGFSSQSHLTAVFHKVTGITPQQFRARSPFESSANEPRPGSGLPTESDTRAGPF